MSDGSTFDLDLRWTATGPVQRYGNNGPFTEGDIRAGHVHNPCLTANYHNHQKFRPASVQGSLDGQPASTLLLLYDIAIFDNWFHWSENAKAKCG